MGMTWICPWAVMLVVTTLGPVAQEQKAPAGQPASAPAAQASQPRKPPQISETLEQLLRNEDRPRRGIPALTDRGSEADAAPGTDLTSGSDLIPEGTVLREQPGRFVRRDGLPQFHFTSAGRRTALPAMEILKNSWLASMEGMADVGVSEFIISAEITQYGGRNYLFLLKYRRQPRHGNLGP